MNQGDIITYYDQRAQEYDAIYRKPEQQRDFERLRLWLDREVKGKHVLEVACGTGHWTSIAVRSADSIVATDINDSMLAVAREKVTSGSVQFLRADAYNLPCFPQHFSCGMAHFWLSHVPKSALAGFLQKFISHLSSDSSMLFIDSKYVPGYRKAPTKTDNVGNAYQQRELRNGSTFEIVKNFLSKRELIEVLQPLCKKVEYEELDYLWAIKAQL